MIPGFEKIVEERILIAQRKGEFDNLEGAGKPLNLDELAGVPEELKLSYKILKNADCLPPEIEIKKEIHKTEDLLAGMDDTAEKYKVMKKLNFLIMKLNSIRKSSVEFEMPEKYLSNLVERFGPKSNKK
ncbi:MAG TPA: DnaJ family domain-containing protein [Draconibacterium sp.]|nr:DnaJ family domain-containing protein [Draconibacterium sp.]